MPTLSIFGASDDLIEIYGIPGADEFNDVSGHWAGLIEAPQGVKVMVYVDYRKNGTWTVALGQFDEDYWIPDWPVTFEVDEELCAYSVKATIEVPDGTTIREFKD